MRPDLRRVTPFLVDRGADRLPHPGGTLYGHLVRVATLLAEWGADADLQAAGLCHACYGTDGYDRMLLGLDERGVLRALIGTRAESLVYLYGSCDRAVVFPRLAQPGQVPFLDRFDGSTHTPAEPDVRAFAELTAANELDVIRHNADMAAQHGAALRRLFTGARARLSDSARQAWSQPAGPVARIGYDGAAAAAFQAARELPLDALADWRPAIARHLALRPGMRVLDLGAGTGTWASALAGWYGISVVAVEPSGAMRARSRCQNMLAGHATGIPLGAATMDAAWLSTVIHHLPDLPAAARELGRVLRPGAPVLIRSAFPGRHQGIGLFRFWPEAIAALAAFPSIDDVRSAFGAAGFGYAALEQVSQVTADSLATVVATARREAHTPLTLISDRAYEAGLARLRAASLVERGPVVDTLDLLVLRKG